ncbi:DNA (cytosine-5-)-methyltransferase [Ranunculus cassubicifolius]
MVSVLNASDLPNFGTDSSEKARVSEDMESEDSGNNHRHNTDEFSLSSVIMDEFDNFVSKSGKGGNKEARVLPKSKAEKLSMKEDKDAKVMMRPGVSDFDSAYARVDEGAAARMSEAFGSEAEKALSYGFEPGDMVWGKVKSHPWWPGHVFNEAFANHSVRRTKRAGHVLVAFFGDSSYGWFDPAELIPFEPHFAEKSKQTISRSFVKAVDEALDEFSRRSALGLTCRCRDSSNFRPTNVAGYFAVDVNAFEPGAIYSVGQIKKAREMFRPRDMLSFVQQLALAPLNFEPKSIDSVKSNAMVHAFRKEAFEEFDETYAEAFGMQPVRSSHDELDQSTKMPTQAHLSGPVVFAEALGEEKSTSKASEALGEKKSTSKASELLGEKKSTSKASKVKEKKDKYLFKRRDEAAMEPRSEHLAETHEPVTVSPAPQVVVTPSPPEDYLFQKRSPVHSTNSEVPEKEEAVHGEGDMVKTQVSTSEIRLPPVSSPVDSGPALQEDRSSGEKLGMTVCETSFPEVTVDSKGETSNFGDKFEEFEFDDQRSSMETDISNQVSEEATARPDIIKKPKSLKRPISDLDNSERSFALEKKKKKKELNSETSLNNSFKRPKTPKGDEILWKTAGKSIGIGLSSDKSPMDHKFDFSNLEVELPQVVDDMLALALDPFYGAERHSAAIVRHVLLRFRSLVYQKSLVLSPSSEAEPVEASIDKIPARTAPENLPGLDTRGPIPGPIQKHPKQIPRPDDPTKAGRKRSPSDRQEEISAKRIKKVGEMKSMAAEKKAKIPPEMQQKLKAKDKSTITKNTNTNVNKPVPARMSKPDSGKRLESASRLSEPAMIVMKFPPQTSLPSPAELKARFGRFGPLDQSAMRIYWKTFMCKVVFKHKSHAQAAYDHALKNNNLFPSTSVRYQLKDVGGAQPSQSEQPSGGADETPVFRPSASGGGSGGDSVLRPGPGSRPRAMMTPKLPKNSQLKSCLKKPTPVVEEVGVSVSREVQPRVKFMLGEDVKEPKSGDGGAMTMDVNIKKFEKFTTPQSLPLPPLPLPASVVPSFPPPPPLLRSSQDVHEMQSRPPGYHDRLVEPNVEPRPIEQPVKLNKIPDSPITTTNATSSKRIDISREMIFLLMRCSEIVDEVKCILGYAPFHPL